MRPNPLLLAGAATDMSHHQGLGRGRGRGQGIVVGPDGGTLAQAQGGRVTPNIHGGFFRVPPGPAFPPGHAPPNFNITTNSILTPQMLLVAGGIQRRTAAPFVQPAAAAAVPTSRNAARGRAAVTPRQTHTGSRRSSTDNNAATRAQRHAAAAAAAAAAAPATNAAAARAAAAAAGNSNNIVPAAADETTGQIQRRTANAMQQNMEVVDASTDSSYNYNVKSYVKFAQRNGIASEPPYITVEGVELWFAEVIAKQTVTPQVAGRRLTSLKHHAAIEQPGVEINLDTPNVKRALDSQRAAYAKAQLEKQTSPHKNLPTSTLTMADFFSMMDYGMRDEGCSSWGDFSFTMTGGNCGFMRMDSMRKLTLSTLVCDTAHGPNREGLASKMVAYILLAGTQKTAGQGTRVAGTWPARDIRRCTEFALAGTLFMSLRFPPEDFSFIANGDGEFSWRDFRVVRGWGDASSAETAYKKVTEYLNINWKHVVHMRSAGIEEASTWACLDPEQISTMSKHWAKKDRLRESYITELNRRVLCALAGFGSEVRGGDGDTDWFVPECFIDIAEKWPNYADLIFPHRQTWIDDCDEPCGDKDACAHNFLHHLLPHLAMRLIQRGIYFITYAPNHELSRALLEVMGPEYRSWAKEMRQSCTKQSKLHQAKVGLKNNMGDTLYDFSERFDRIEREMKKSRTARRKERKSRKTDSRRTNQLLESIVEQQRQILARTQSQSSRPSWFRRGSTGVGTDSSIDDTGQVAPLLPTFPPPDSSSSSETDSSSSSSDDESDDDSSAAAGPVAASASAASRSASARSANRSTDASSNARSAARSRSSNTSANRPPARVRGRFRNDPVVVGGASATSTPAARPRLLLHDRAMEPTIPKLCPKTVKEVLSQHNQGNWNRLRNADRRNWRPFMEKRYSRRQQMYDCIEHAATQLRTPSDLPSRMIAAADSMDREIVSKKMTVSKFFEKYRKELGKVQQRKKRQSDGI